MFKHFKNERGISLIMVIILLVLVGGLTAALLTAGIFNIGFGSDEVDRAQAFYAADAGVEYTKNALKSLDFTDNDQDLFESITTENTLAQDNISFKVELLEETNKEVTYISTGKVDSGFNNRTVSQKIEFSFDKSLFYDTSLLLNDPKNVGLATLIGMEAGLKETEDERLSKDNITPYNLGSWWEFLDGEEYIEYDFEEMEVADYLSFTGQVESIEKIAGGGEGFEFEEGKDYFFTKPRVEIGEEPEEYIEGQGYDEGEIIIYEELYYVATQDIPADEDGDYDEDEDYSPNNPEYWKHLDDYEEDLDLKGGVVIRDSVVIVDGSLTTALGNVRLENSLVLVRNKIDIGGTLHLNKSLILAFNEDYDNDEHSFDHRGTVRLTRFTRDDIQDKWKGIEEIFSDPDFGGLTEDVEFKYWRQIQ